VTDLEKLLNSQRMELKEKTLRVTSVNTQIDKLNSIKEDPDLIDGLDKDLKNTESK